MICKSNSCFSYNSWVMTEMGFRRIGDLATKPTNIKLYSAINFICEKPKEFYNNGVNTIYRIETEEGYIIETTEDQEIYVNNFQITKEVRELIPTLDKILINDNCVLSDCDSEDFFKGTIIGYNWGELIPEESDISVWISKKYPLTRNFFLKNIVKLGYSIRTMELQGDTYIIISKNIFPQLKNIESIMEMNWNFIRGFISGYITRRAILKSGIKKYDYIRVPGDCFDLRHIQIMLTAFGIISIKKYNTRLGGHEIRIAGGNFDKFINDIGFIDSDLMEDGIRRRYKRNNNRKRVIRYATVLNIERIGKENVYGAYIKSDSNFIINGIKVEGHSNDCRIYK